MNSRHVADKIKLRQPLRSGRDVVYKPLDGADRARIYFTEVVDLTRFLGACQALEAEVRDLGGSRWTARGMVVEREPILAISNQLGLGVGPPLEIVSIPVKAAGRDADYLWISRNSSARMPSPAARASFGTSMGLHRRFQDQLSGRFHEHVHAVLRAARTAGLSVVCNDPAGEWGTDRLPRETFRRLVDEAFYVDRASADALLEGDGYSPLGHCMFGLLDRHGELLCILMIATWPWGFEVTYGILNRGYAASPSVAADLSQVGSAGTVLMIVAVALQLSRHRNRQLIYGEANVGNCRPCIKAGFELAPLEFGDDQPVHRNVVWADNPIGAHGIRAAQPLSGSPHPSVTDYVSYALMTLGPEKLEPHIVNAMTLLNG